MEKQYRSFEDLDAYKMAYELCNLIWDIVVTWDNFAKWSLEKQYTSAADSVSANIEEGFGRYYKKEKIQFYRYSYGSLQETKDWTQKARYRRLLSEEDYKKIMQRIEQLPKAINSLILYTNQKLKY
ncbi:MAG: four helix bundle protein [Bacteroidota bacterium]